MKSLPDYERKSMARASSFYTRSIRKKRYKELDNPWAD
jgi:hypothetical protein